MTEDNIRQKQKAVKNNQNRKELLESKNTIAEIKSIQQEGQENLLKQKKELKNMGEKRKKKGTEEIDSRGLPSNYQEFYQERTEKMEGKKYQRTNRRNCP